MTLLLSGSDVGKSRRLENRHEVSVDRVNAISEVLRVWPCMVVLLLFLSLIFVLAI